MSAPSFSFRLLLWGLAALLGSCTDPYLPEAVTSPPSYLVVDGFLNSQGVTTIKLSRTYAIAAKTAPPVETRATVYIEDDAGTRQLLTEGSVKGTYTSAAQVLNPARKYRLHLNTLAGKEYASDYVPVKTTPLIDAVTWRPTSEGLTIYVSTHDATNSTQYYRWETDETWEIHPTYLPSVEYVMPAGQIQPIRVPYPSVCYGNAHSAVVLLDKTTALTQDVVADYPVKLLPPTTERLYMRYSILLQQHALTKEEYSYWELLRKNTESIGTLFDPQPAQLTGNVHCLTNPKDVALGFVGAHSLTEKRIFIAYTDLPRNWPRVSGYESCVPPDSVFLVPKGVNPPPKPAEVLRAAFASQEYLPIDPFYIGGFVGGYLAKSRDCVDCRTRGSAIKPSYWP